MIFHRRSRLSSNMWKGLSYEEYTKQFMRCPICNERAHHRIYYRVEDFPNAFKYWAKCLDLHLWHEHVVPLIENSAVKPPERNGRWEYISLINKEREKALEGLWIDSYFSEKVKKNLAAEIANLQFASKNIKELAKKIKKNPSKPSNIHHFLFPDQEEIEELIKVHPWAVVKKDTALKCAAAVAKTPFQFRVAFLFYAAFESLFSGKIDKRVLKILRGAASNLAGEMKRKARPAFKLKKKLQKGLTSDKKRYFLTANLFLFYERFSPLKEGTKNRFKKAIRNFSFPLHLSIFLSGEEDTTETIRAFSFKEKYYVFLAALALEGLRDGRVLSDIKLKEVIDIIPSPLRENYLFLPKDWREGANMMEAIWFAANNFFKEEKNGKEQSDRVFSQVS